MGPVNPRTRLPRLAAAALAAVLLGCGGGASSYLGQAQPRLALGAQFTQMPDKLTAGQAGYVAAVTEVSGATYAWTLQNAALTAGAGTRQISFTAGSAGPVTLTCVVRAGGASQTLILTLACAPGPILQGPAEVVAGTGTRTFSTTPVAGASYAWTVVGGSILDGQGTPSVTILPGAGAGTGAAAARNLRAAVRGPAPAAGTTSLGVTLTQTLAGAASSTSLNLPLLTQAGQPPAGLAYALNPATCQVGVASVADAPTSTGGTILTYSVAPALPAGLSLDAATGVISGTPDAAAPATDYLVTAANAAGSAGVLLNLGVLPGPAAPSIAAQPQSLSVVAGSSASFSVTAAGTAPFTYQWRRDGALIPGATGRVYVMPPAKPGDDGATFQVAVVNAAGSVTSAQATLTVTEAAVAPTITTALASRTVQPGQTATFTVAAAGTAPLAYAWSRNGTDIPGAAAASLTTPAAALADNGTVYQVKVSNAAGAATSSAQLLVVAPPTAPAITAQPASRSVVAGATASFQVAATGSAPLTYQWYRNNVAVPFATAAAYTTPATTLADSGASFTVVVSNAAGTATSNPAVLTVTAAAVAPSITGQPQSITATEGQSATFSVAAAGTFPLAYQWRRGGAPIAGATGASYSIPATTLADSGASFSVVVSNAAGTATSSAAVLTVKAATVAPLIVTQPQPVAVTAGQTATFSVAASGTAPLFYQWRRGGSAIAGATGASYTTAATTLADSGASFSVVVTNAAGTATSDPAVLTVTAAAVAPSITGQPLSLTVTVGQSATFSVTASGTAPLAYQWLRDGVVIPGATSAGYVLTNASAADSGAKFMAQVSNAAGSVASQAAVLTVQSAPVITVAPLPQSATVGGSATFSVTAAGTGPLGYQWLKDGAAIAGATLSDCTLSGLALGDDGAMISVVVTNPAGTATSTPVRLTVTAVQTAPVIVVPVQPQHVASGTPVSFTVTASGTGLGYAWYSAPAAGPEVLVSTTAAYALTPTYADNGRTVRVVVSNSLGSVASGPVALTVDPIKPAGLAYAAPSPTYYSFSVIPDNIPVVTADPAPVFTATGLPEGLYLDPATGVISSIPTRIYLPPAGPANVTVTATNVAGSATTVLSILVKGAIPVISYGGSVLTYPQGVAMSVLPTNAGAAATSWTLTPPSLPAGLQFDAGTGRIHGTASAPFATLHYTVAASNANGTGETGIDLVGQGQIAFRYGDDSNQVELPVGVAAQSPAPIVTRGPATIGWSLQVKPGYPVLQGLGFNGQTGQFTGTFPVAMAGQQSVYQVTALDPAGVAWQATVDVTVRCVAPAKPVISYGTLPSFQVGRPVSIRPSNTGGAAISYAKSGTLPAGLNFDTATGRISGTPLVAGSFPGVAVTAKNQLGGASAPVTLDFSVANERLQPTFGTLPIRLVTSTTLGMNYSGRLVAALAPSLPAPVVGTWTWSISPAFSDPLINLGLTMDPATGAISGTPGATLPPTVFTVTATESTTHETATANLTLVVDAQDTQGPGLGYPNHGQLVFSLGQPAAFAPNDRTGDDLVLVFADNSGRPTPVPAGLTFNPATGVLSGTPTALLPTTQYKILVQTVLVNNGDTEAGISVTVNADPIEPPRDLTYAPSPATFFLRQPNCQLTPFVAGGAPTAVGVQPAFEVSPALPAGLALDPSTGVISGAPTVPAAPATYTVTARNALGATTFDLQLGVNNLKPDVTYGSFLSVRAGAPFTITPSSIGGLVTAWSGQNLPAGVSLNAANGVLTGLVSGAGILDFTVIATNSAGSVMVPVRLQVFGPDASTVPETLTYVTDARNGQFVLPWNQPIDPLVPMALGGPLRGDATTFVVAPYSPQSLPDGLTLDPTTGVITGTTSLILAASTPIPITVTATFADGRTADATFTLAVVPPPIELVFPYDGATDHPVNPAVKPGDPLPASLKAKVRIPGATFNEVLDYQLIQVGDGGENQLIWSGIPMNADPASTSDTVVIDLPLPAGTAALTDKPRLYYLLVHGEYTGLDADSRGAAQDRFGQVRVTLPPLPEVRFVQVYPEGAFTLQPIPNGTFTMGFLGTPDANDAGQLAALPRRRVTLTQPFYMSTYLFLNGTAKDLAGTRDPVPFSNTYLEGPTDATVDGLLASMNTATQAAFAAVQDPAYDPATATNLQQLAAALPVLDGASPTRGWVWRLPTEAEWEFAARGDTTTLHIQGDAPVIDPSSHHNTWFLDATYGINGATSLDLQWFTFNPFGLYDMQGDLAQIVQDWYGPLPEALPGPYGDLDPVGPAAAAAGANPVRVVRSGSYWEPAAASRTYARRRADQAVHDPAVEPNVGATGNGVGFRVVLAPARPVPAP